MAGKEKMWDVFLSPEDIFHNIGGFIQPTPLHGKRARILSGGSYWELHGWKICWQKFQLSLQWKYTMYFIIAYPSAKIWLENEKSRSKKNSSWKWQEKECPMKCETFNLSTSGLQGSANINENREYVFLFLWLCLLTYPSKLLWTVSRQPKFHLNVCSCSGLVSLESNSERLRVVQSENVLSQTARNTRQRWHLVPLKANWIYPFSSVCLGSLFGFGFVFIMVTPVGVFKHYFCPLGDKQRERRRRESFWF